MVLGGLQQVSSPLATSPGQVPRGLGFRLADPRDRNQNGVVSSAEIRAYELDHPQVAWRKELTNPARTVPQTTTRGTVAAAMTPASQPKANQPWSASGAKDANRDGRVDGLERRAWTEAHPWERDPVLDPMDTDQDGVVTPAEEASYRLQHPEAAPVYTATGGAPARTSGGLVDAYA